MSLTWAGGKRLGLTSQRDGSTPSPPCGIRIIQIISGIFTEKNSKNCQKSWARAFLLDQLTLFGFSKRTFAARSIAMALLALLLILPAHLPPFPSYFCEVFFQCEPPPPLHQASPHSLASGQTTPPPPLLVVNQDEGGGGMLYLPLAAWCGNKK